MATADSVREKIEQLISAANGATGNADADLTAAVNALIAGYGRQQEDGGLNDLIKSIVEGTAIDISLGPDITEIRPYAFYQIGTLKSFDFSYITKIGSAAFSGCSNLDSIDIPNWNPGGNSATRMFQNCTNLKSVNLPGYIETTSTTIQMFVGCTALTDVNMPVTVELGFNMFYGCSSLRKIDLPKTLVTLKSSCLYGTSMETLIIRNDEKIANLVATSALSGTPIESGTGYIYVPAALVEEYKAATNWVTFADQIRAIEDYPEITGGTT